MERLPYLGSRSVHLIARPALAVPGKPRTLRGRVTEAITHPLDHLVPEPPVGVLHAHARRPVGRRPLSRELVGRVIVSVPPSDARYPVPADGERWMHPLPVSLRGLDLIGPVLPPLAPVPENLESVLDVVAARGTDRVAHLDVLVARGPSVAPIRDQRDRFPQFIKVGREETRLVGNGRALPLPPVTIATHSESAHHKLALDLVEQGQHLHAGDEREVRSGR